MKEAWTWQKSLNIDFHKVLCSHALTKDFSHLQLGNLNKINDIIAKANHYQYCKNKSIKIYHARCYFHPSIEQSINKSINNAVSKEIIKHCSLALTLAGNYIHNRSSRNLRWCSPNCIPRWGGFVTLLNFVSLAFGLMTNTQ